MFYVIVPTATVPVTCTVNNIKNFAPSYTLLMGPSSTPSLCLQKTIYERVGPADMKKCLSFPVFCNTILFTYLMLTCWVVLSLCSCLFEEVSLGYTKISSISALNW